MDIKQELAELTNNFTEVHPAVKCYTEFEKEQAKDIFNEYYDIVEVSDGRKADNDRMSYIIACSSPKQIEESLQLNEDNDFEEPDLDNDIEQSAEIPEEDSIEDEEELDLSDIEDLDDPNDDSDLADLDVDTVDDASKVEEADQLTVLKKRASDVAEQWKDLFKQISDLAKSLDLVASHNEDLEIEIHKANGETPDVEQDLETIEQDYKDTLDNNSADEFEDDIDDDFGPSEYDDRIKDLKDEPVGESIEIPQNIAINESSVVNVDPNELHISEDEIDDDF